jgi:hypothetical protein
MRFSAFLLVACALGACKTNEITNNNNGGPQDAGTDATDDGSSSDGATEANACNVTPVPLSPANVNLNAGASFQGHSVPQTDVLGYATTETVTGPDGGNVYNQIFALVFASRKAACADALAGVVRQDEDQFIVGISFRSDTSGTIAPGTYVTGPAFPADAGANLHLSNLAPSVGFGSFTGANCLFTTMQPNPQPNYGIQIVISVIDQNHAEGTIDAVYGAEETKGQFNVPLCPVQPKTMNLTCCN